MLKHHKFISFCLALIFGIVVQEFAGVRPVFRFLLPAVLVFCAVVTLYNRWYLKQIGRYNVWLLVRPVLLLGAAFGIYFNIPSLGVRSLFLAVSVGVITVFEIVLGNLLENLLLNETLLVAFGIFFACFGAYHYAPGYQLLYLLSACAGSFLLARSFYELLPEPREAKLVGALVLDLFCGELYWVLNFLPFHFSVLSILLFNLFYFCLLLNYYHLFHLLSLKKVQFHLFLISATTILVLLTTPWRIISN